MGNEIAVAGAGLKLQMEITPGTKARVVSAAETSPSISVVLSFICL